MSDSTSVVLRHSFPIHAAGRAPRSAQHGIDASLRFLCERAEDALQEHAHLIEAGDRLRRSMAGVEA